MKTSYVLYAMLRSKVLFSILVNTCHAGTKDNNLYNIGHISHFCRSPRCIYLSHIYFLCFCTIYGCSLELLDHTAYFTLVLKPPRSGYYLTPVGCSTWRRT